MGSLKLRAKFIEYFQKHGHAVVPSSSLIPDNDPSVLLTTAGMQQFKPYFLGQRDPKADFGSRRLTSVQKCFRTSDIEPVGDEYHNTFFEMLGNFAIGDYFKAEAIAFAWEFLVKELHVQKEKLWVTVFGGDGSDFEADDAVPKDSEAAEYWSKYLPKERILEFGRDTNWWGPPGATGSCGPSSEIHYDRTGQPCAKGNQCLPNCDCGRYVELWNLVFTEFEKTKSGRFKPLPAKNIDTGLGLERLASVIQKKPTIFETDLFEPIIEAIKRDQAFGRLSSESEDQRRVRIVADHLRAAIFLLSDGVRFSNKSQGYTLRRIIRRAIDQFAEPIFKVGPIVETVVKIYGRQYPDLLDRQPEIVSLIQQECNTYSRLVKADIRSVFVKMKKQRGEAAPVAETATDTPSSRPITADEAFHLYTTYGFSPERLKRDGYTFDETAFQAKLKEHQAVSKASQVQFKGGLADNKPNTIRGHTATHLLQQALRDVLGPQVSQKGSSITEERVRFDFVHPDKLTPEQLKQAEAIVNQKIKDDLPVIKQVVSLDEAKAMGATGLFEEKYGENVSVYLIGSEDPQKAYSKEFCGGPHVRSTGQIGSFKITKEESSSAGVRRIRATVSAEGQLDEPVEAV